MLFSETSQHSPQLLFQTLRSFYLLWQPPQVLISMLAKSRLYHLDYSSPYDYL